MDLTGSTSEESLGAPLSDEEPWASSPLGSGERYEPVGDLLLEPITVMVVMTAKAMRAV